MIDRQKTLEVAASQLKSYGIKNTPQRQIILAFLMSTDTHPTIEMIEKYVSNNGLKVSLATIYNTLKLFMDRKLVIEVSNDNTGHMKYDYFVRPHYHVICTECNKVVDVFDDSFLQYEQKATEQTGFIVHSSKFEIYGLCPNCQQKS